MQKILTRALGRSASQSPINNVASAGVYEGEYNAAGQSEGYGTSRYANGNVYEGQWKADKAEGRGTARYADGDVYEGEYKADKMEGSGTYRYTNGLHKVGFFKAGKDVGEGVLFSADGQTAARLRDGKFVMEARRIDAHGLPLPEGVVDFTDV